MEQSFADLLSGAFSETAVPSFPDGDLDFENLNFDEKFEEDKTQENLPTKEDEGLQQEATAVLSNMEKDIYTAEHVDEEQCDDKSDEEDFEGVRVMSMDKAPEEDYTSSDSEQDSSASGEDEEDEEEDTGTGEEPGNLLRSVCYTDEFYEGNKEDRIFAEGQPLAPQGAENPQVRNEEQGESDEETSYFKRVPEGGGERMMRGDRSEEDEQEREEEKEEDLSDSECEGMKIEQGENVLAGRFELELENPCRDDPVKASLEFPEISVQSLQDLIAEVDSEECVEKMKDFSGDEHQDAGESFAEYPSDFSSCEYVEDKGDNQESNHQSDTSACASDSGSVAKDNAYLERERAVADVTWMGAPEDTDEEEDGYLYSRDLEAESDKFRNLDVAATAKETVENVLGDVTGCGDEGETDESDSYTSSDDEVQEKRSDEELSDSMYLQESNKQLEETESGSGAAFSDDFNRANPADFNINWNLDVLTSDTILSEDLLTTEDADEAETPLSDLTQRPAEDINSYSDLRTTSPSNQGSLDDSFFFNTEPEASGITELGQLGDDEYEDDRNWEQEQERIKAFYKFYDDDDGENEREGRQIKVQFCADPLSEVIHYETDSSDRDSLSSSTEGEEDQSSAETSEELREPDDTPPVTPACDPPNTKEPPEKVPDIDNTQICTRKHKCFNMLKLTLKMGLVILAGLLMFWLATDQAGWFSYELFF
uniref:dentin matrix acidic phosphoprotein 1 isoform X1 n=1 Tax=Epinephelus lanceolatus TaxID=310571 RepID=UPI001446561D|nr:dentin matrix acidic phosphoprotein 1 isoform X1 [Epinephelus lanceolatus]